MSVAATIRIQKGDFDVAQEIAEGKLNVLAQIGLGYWFVFLMTGRSFRVQLLVFVAILAGGWCVFDPRRQFDNDTAGRSALRTLERTRLPDSMRAIKYRDIVSARLSRRMAAITLLMSSAGFRLVSGGTDNHLMLVDVFSKGDRKSTRLNSSHT